ncbi:sugar ABC transporter substrate-binding protein [Propionicimonas sp.]|uniref:ABC transporter substrate-binding protein n=1 Tax=Propionicimonas sp. TaxID=1955623 RepID=UPI0017AEDDE5|nr:sugar ABC transporter substrate-binding protein [Propionicimonas sp.]MBU3976894.1 sugar ABC transporter substrate-binding protein [Actinomycetota bacterium]MBA3019583.1 sugar ABC transporter substrate-binding protein [Propionicimonas sp.]MBU3986989.1 sugar ABC transporter substrate-binding protein [Actinomycetota bacterium]MBU4006901.1 sugar ABC transporter substrate-binding protein [Actinomycetota bacterium]MBU4065601.1 sugar ABC transporter substrate-binding protein [Actinomycetota bacter
MRKKYLAGIAAMAAAALAMTGCTGGGTAPSASNEGPVTLEFAQWWEPELPANSLRSLMDKFESENPGIKVKLISGPYASTKEQVVAGAAAGTMSDVVGLDGAWVNDFVKQGSLANLTDLMKSANFDESQLAAQVKLDGSTWMIPVANFVYPMFVNDDLLKKAGVAAVPTNRTEFAAAAAAVTKTGKNTSGWVLPLDTATPNGIQNDVMSWVWASGGSMLKDGKPYLVGNTEVKDTMTFIKGMYDAGSIAKGSFTMKEQDKVNEFTNGRVGMMIDSLAHVNLIREENKDLKFSVAAIPSADGYSGKRGMPYASWGIGVANNSKHQAEAFKLVSFLMGKDVNATLCNSAHAFPGNTQAVPDFVNSDPIFKQAFEIYQAGTATNEFTGLPVAEDLMRSFDEQFQKYLAGKQSADDALAASQSAWEKAFSG